MGGPRERLDVVDCLKTNWRVWSATFVAFSHKQMVFLAIELLHESFKLGCQKSLPGFVGR